MERRRGWGREMGVRRNIDAVPTEGDRSCLREQHSGVGSPNGRGDMASIYSFRVRRAGELGMQIGKWSTQRSRFEIAMNNAFEIIQLYSRNDSKEQ